MQARGYLFDTHAWIWAFSDRSCLSRAARNALAASPGAYIASISFWEVAMLEAKGRIQLPIPLLEWFRLASPYNLIKVLHLNPDIAIESTHLPGVFHPDPADRIIVATARVHSLTIITSDAKIRNYPHISTLPAS
jgi:PIN domain nuclease of toxin-antitoxin system